MNHERESNGTTACTSEIVLFDGINKLGTPSVLQYPNVFKQALKYLFEDEGVGGEVDHPLCHTPVLAARAFVE